MNARFYRLIMMILLLGQGLVTVSPAAAAPLRQPPEVALASPFELIIGDEALVGESPDAHFLFFSAVLRDTRCPIGTQCVKAGDALFQLFVSDESRADVQMIEIGTAADQNVVQYQDYVIELLDVDPPAPKPDENFILIEYHLTLVMRAADESTGTPAPAPTKAAPPQRQTAPAPAPQVVAHCPNFTAFDAAAILQEPVNADEPIGNLLFGPLPVDLLGEEGGVQGFCGYASALPTAGEDQPDQTHLLTQLATAHAVVADRLSADIVPASNGTVLTDWFDLFALAEVVGAANPDHDSDAVFETLYNFAGHLPLLEILQADASAAPSFTVQNIPLDQADPHVEMLWLWQTLDDGYFSVLIARQDLAFDLVAARLGAQVQEKTVLGYSRVLLDKLTAQESTAARTAGDSGCDLLTVEQVVAIMGEPVQGQAVSNEQGAGCKYTPVADELTVDPDDFSSRFQTHGVLAGLVPSLAAQELLTGMINELATTGQVTDGLAFGELLVAVDEEEWRDVLEQMGLLDWASNQWQVETLKVISDDTLLITGTAGNGWPKFFLMRPAPEGGLYYLTGELKQDLNDAYGAIIAAARQLGADSTAAPAATVASVPVAASFDEACPWVTLAEVAALLGEAVQQQAVASARGAGCKYIPQTEDAWVEPDDFSPTFESYGVLVGLMPTSGAQWLLSEFLSVIEESNTAVDEATFAALQANVEAGAIDDALHQLATLTVTAGEWQIEALPAVSDAAMSMYSDQEGYRLAFFLRSAADDGMVALAVQLPLDRDVEAMQAAVVEILSKLEE